MHHIDTTDALQRVIRTAADHIPGLVWTSLPDGYIDFLNRQWCEFTGLTPEQACGWGWQAAIHADDLPSLLQTWGALLANGAAGEAEARLRRADGEYRWCSFRAVPLRDAQGQLLRWYGQTLDIDDVKRAEALLAGEKQLLERVARGDALQHILEALCRLVEELAPGTMAAVMLLEPTQRRLWTKAAPTLPRGYVEAVDGCLIDQLPGPCAQAASTAEALEVSDITTDVRWGEYADIAERHGVRALLSMPILSSASEVLGTIAMYFSEPRKPTTRQLNIMEQLTHLAAVAVERQRTDAALQASEERFRRMADTTPDVIWITELDPERVVYASPSFERIWGLRVEDLYREPHLWIDSIHPEDRPRIGTAFMAWTADRERRQWDAEFRILRPDGTVRWIHERGVGLASEGGRQRVSGISTDITERRTAEQALLRSQQRHALAMEAARDGHWDWIIEDDEFYASARMLEIYGFPPETRFNGRQDFLDRFAFHLEDRARWQQAVTEHFAGQSARFEIEMRMYRHGELRWIQQNGLLSRDAAGRPVRWTGSVRDITDRMAGEAALRASEQRFALAVAGSNDGIWDWDIVRDEIFWSERAQRLHGLEPNAAVLPRSQWQQCVKLHPDDAVPHRELVEAYLAGKVPAYDGEWRVQHADGSFRWVRIRGVCVRDADGRATRMAGSVSDVDAQKRAEAALLKAQRLEATGTLAGGIAHDFNNILGAILGYGEMALRDVRAGTRLHRDLDSILVAAERGRSLVDRILAFSRSGVGERTPVHVEGVVREALDLLSATLPSSVRIETQLAAGRAAMRGDATQIHQVVMNLATNAVQALADGGVVGVSLELETLTAAHVATTGTVDAGDYIVLRVGDGGCGIAREIIDKIFDPFFTTKEVGAGTGLGLSLVHGIVSDVGGAVDVQSSPALGSTFTVYLPRCGDAPESVDDAADDLPRGGRQQVLVVDDEEPLVRLATENLAEWGYVPVGFTSSLGALEAFRAHPERYDAVITDERMPGLSGSALLREIRAIRPAIPTMLVSGYVGTELASRARAAGADEVLKKPLSMRDLATGLARLLQD